jgi:hypothetical protein
MTQPQWDRSRGAWNAKITCAAYGPIDVLIITEGASVQPNEKQLAVLARIGSLAKLVRKVIRKEVKRYAREVLEEEELDDFEAEDFDIAFSDALIPRLRDSEADYFFLYGESDIDIEHGLACLCRNEEAFRVCHSDAMYENYECDAIDKFESLLRSG